MIKIATKASEGQAIAQRIEECVDNIKVNLVEFARLVNLLLEDSELMKAAGWENKHEMYADPIIKNGLSYAMSIESEWQVYRLENMLALDAALPEADILETPHGWTDITQTRKMRELKDLVESNLTHDEKVEKAREIVHRPREKQLPEESHLIKYDPQDGIVSIDGIPAIQFTTDDANKRIRVLSRLIHDTDKLVVVGGKYLTALNDSGRMPIGDMLVNDPQLELWIMKRLRARRGL